MKLSHLICAGGAIALAGCATPPEAVPAPPETGAYMVVLGTVHDREAFMAGYASRLGPLYEKYGGSYVAIGRGAEVLEGEPNFQSHVISRWPDMESARAFWASPEYEALKDARIEGEWGTFEVFLVEALPVPAN